MTPHRRARTGLLTLAAVLITGCGSASVTTITITTTNSSSSTSSSSSGVITSPPPGCSNPTSAFGAVCTVSGPATVGPYTAPGGGTPINKGNAITTAAGSDLLFWISVKIRKCDLYPPSSGKLIIWPTPGPLQKLIQWQAGQAVCSTTHNNGPVYLGLGRHAKITLNDPVFAFAIDSTGAVTIQVISGSLSVTTDKHPQPITINAGGQVMVKADGMIAVPPTPFSLKSLPPQEQAGIARVVS